MASCSGCCLVRWSLLMIVLFSFCSIGYSVSTSRYGPTTATHHKVGLTCEDSYCDSHCCFDSSSDSLICCNDEDVTDLWWFWLCFVIGILFFSMCCGTFCCRFSRTRQQRQRYLIIPGERAQVTTSYGSESISPVIRAPYNYYNQFNSVPAPQYPQSKLPSYTPEAESKGNPPPYQFES